MQTSGQKSILITGASSGIGYDAALAMRAAGWRVFASCRKPDDCARLAGLGFDAPVLDYASDASITEGVGEVLEATGGRLDAVFNNGAFAIPGAVEDLPRAALREIFETNLFGVHELTRQVIPVMRAQGHGRIVNNSSVLGLVALRMRGAYVSSKFALEGLTDTLRLELRGSGIHPILIEPGPVTSKIRVNSIPHFERHIDWENSAQSVLYRDRLRPRLYHSSGPDPFELPAGAVSKVLLRALTARKPRARYYVTKPTYLFGFARRILSSAGLDAILSKA